MSQLSFSDADLVQACNARVVNVDSLRQQD